LWGAWDRGVEQALLFSSLLITYLEPFDLNKNQFFLKDE